MIYADFNGSALVCDEVKKYLIERLQSGPYANPNAIHSMGAKVLAAMEKARKVSAKILGANKKQLVFNSGSSEGISHIFHSVLDKPENFNQGQAIIISGIEHSAVIQAAKYWQGKGYELEVCPVNEDGVTNLDAFKSILDKYNGKLALVSIMAANNETGVVQPYKEIGKLCQEYKVPFFSDTTQYIGKAEFNFAESEMDYAVLSGHKIGSTVGAGIVLAKEPTTLTAHVHGGGQERGVRGGTQNYLGNECIAVALSAFEQNKAELAKLRECRDNFEAEIAKRHPGVVIFGKEANRVPSTTMISLPGIHGQAVQIELESQDIFVTTSSACSDNEPETSKVLKAMGVQDDVGRGVIRVSLCSHGAEENYKMILEALDKAYTKLSKIETN